ncbi:MAG: hypothetical protein EOP49_14035, partial [Sphingobacteriales bacterium]
MQPVDKYHINTANFFTVMPAGDRFFVCETASSWSVIPGGFLTRHYEDGSRDPRFNTSALYGRPPGATGPLWMSVQGMTPDYFSIRPAVAGFSVLGYFSSVNPRYFARPSYRLDSSGTGYPREGSESESGSIVDFVVHYNGSTMVWGNFNGPKIDFPWTDKSFILDSRIHWDYCYGITALPNGDSLIQMAIYPPLDEQWKPWKFTLHHVDGNGALTASYEAEEFVSAPVVQPDGRILVPGSFTVLAGQPVKYFARLAADGTLDTGFAPDLNGPVTSATLQADGKILVGGGFTSVGGVERRFLARLNGDGTLDPSFNAHLNQPVMYVALQGNGKVFAVTKVPYNPQSKVSAAISRHFNDPAVSTLQRPDRSTVRWLRGGSAPEVQVVTLDFRTSSQEEWRRLGKARRIAGGWELSDDSLPEGGELSAKGWILGENRHTGWVEAVLAPPAVPAPALAEWRTLHFGSADNSGDGADGSDPDRDGVINLMEYAMGQNPKKAPPSTFEPPVWSLSDGALECRFTSAPVTTPLTFTAEWS